MGRVIYNPEIFFVLNKVRQCDFEGISQDKQFTAHAIRRRDSLKLVMFRVSVIQSL
jgi:hypothetical protein